jgi:hypothetical protein
MRPYTTKEKAGITAGAVAALVTDDGIAAGEPTECFNPMPF